MHGALSILLYRRVCAAPDPLFPERLDSARFAAQLRQLRRWFRVLPLEQALRRLREGSLPARAAAISFDGGYADHAEVALPLLQRFNLPATFFVATGFLDGGYRWSDAIIELVRKAPGPRLNLARSGFGAYDVSCPLRRRAVIDLLLTALASLPLLERIERVRAMASRVTPTMLSVEQLLALHRAGMAIGGHTVTLQPLASLSNAEARAEIGNGRARLEDIVQAPVRVFSYPRGQPGADFETRHTHMLRSAGFDAAVTRACGAARPTDDPYALPRIVACSGSILLPMVVKLLRRA
jgi:peptidoglycan/xylan/chitin deacetylase (PgdA/CDA1 family)